LEGMLSPDESAVIPKACEIVGMTSEEYQYLTRSAVLSFEAQPE